MDLARQHVTRRTSLLSPHLSQDSTGIVAVGRGFVALGVQVSGPSSSSEDLASVSVMAASGAAVCQQLYACPGKHARIDGVFGRYMAVVTPLPGISVYHGMSSALLATWAPPFQHTGPSVSFSCSGSLLHHLPRDHLRWLPDASGLQWDRVAPNSSPLPGRVLTFASESGFWVSAAGGRGWQMTMFESSGIWTVRAVMRLVVRMCAGTSLVEHCRDWCATWGGGGEGVTGCWRCLAHTSSALLHAHVTNACTRLCTQLRRPALRWLQ